MAKRGVAITLKMFVASWRADHVSGLPKSAFVKDVLQTGCHDSSLAVHFEQ